MARFHLQGNLFGRPVTPATDEETDQGDGLPNPKLVKLNARRLAGLKEARDALAHLPAPGESLHAIATSRFDLSDLVGCLFERLGPCASVRVATLSYHARNLKAMLGWLDSAATKELTLLCSIFFRSHKGGLWAEALAELRRRGQRAACVHSHAKVITLEFASGQKLSIEGSANLAGNGSGREQFAIVNDAGLHDWHADWILDQVGRGEAKEKAEAEKTEAAQ